MTELCDTSGINKTKKGRAFAGGPVCLPPSLPPSILPRHELAGCHVTKTDLALRSLSFSQVSLSLTCSRSRSRCLSQVSLSLSLALALSLARITPPHSLFVSFQKRQTLSPLPYSHPPLSRTSDNHKLFPDVHEGRACGLSTPSVCVCVCECVCACVRE